MATKETAKPASKRTFTKGDVKMLYEAIKNGDRRQALSLAFAASGSFKVRKRSSGYRSTVHTTTYRPMELAIEKDDRELLEAFRPHVDITEVHEDIFGSWFGWAWRNNLTRLAALFVSWLPNFRDDDGNWLRQAASKGSMELIELALPVSNPLAKGEVGETALMAAADGMRIEAVNRLLPISDPNALDDKGRDALMHALEGQLRRVSPNSGYVLSDDALACFQSLINACGVHRRDASGMSAMSRLVRKSETPYNDEWKSIPTEFAELLVAAGAGADEADPAGAGMLMKAIEAGDERLFEQLLPSSKLDQVDGEGFTPLLKAAELGRSSMVAALAPLSDCNRQGADGSTALMLSAQGCDLPSVRLLCSKTNRALRDSKGRTASMIAAEKVAKDKSGVNELLIFLRLFDPASAKGQGILPWLVGIPELFEAALPFCDPNDKDTNGQIALHRAIDLSDLSAFEKLLPVSDIRAADGNGTTPLMLSIQKNYAAMSSVFHALLPASDAQAVDAKGKTALMLAADRGKLEMVKALLPSSNAKSADHEGLTALMIAAMDRDIKIAAALMPSSDANAIDKDGKTALMHSMESWNLDEELILFLAERSDLTMISERGRAAMAVAMKMSRFPQGAAGKLQGMMSARSERDELLSVMAEPTKASGKRKIDAFYAAPKAKRPDSATDSSGETSPKKTPRTMKTRRDTI